jgi:hypothetical protein
MTDFRKMKEARARARQGKKPGTNGPHSPGTEAAPARQPAPPEPAAPAGRTSAKVPPDIIYNRRQLPDVTGDALAALLAANTPPVVFKRQGVLTRIRRDEATNAPYLDPMTDAAVRGRLARVADWFRVQRTRQGNILEADSPPMTVVQDLVSLDDWEGVPALVSVVECPVFTRDGELVIAPGYHAGGRVWYEPAPGLSVPPVPEKPSRDDISRARSLLLDDLLGEFPYVDQPSKANAVAALLLPFVRQLIDGPTPLHLIDAPTPGTGKTLLANALSIVSTGRDAEATSAGQDEDEWRKFLFAAVRRAPTYLLIDNVRGLLQSAALAMALTTRIMQARVLGVSKMATVPVLCAWLATGNNVQLSFELIRRTVLVRLDARSETPWQGREFKHPKLIGWARRHRGELVQAALTLCRAWLVRGRPAATTSLGMFDEWAETMGGLFDVAGIPGLLGNADALLRDADHEGPQWRAFAAAWWAAHGNQPVTSAQLFDLAAKGKFLGGVLVGKDEPANRVRLGMALAKKRDSVCGQHRIVGAGPDRTGAQTYRLEPTAPPSKDKGTEERSA